MNRKTKAKKLGVILSAALFLAGVSTGCGSKQAETVTDYGGKTTASGAGTEAGTETGQTEESGKTESTAKSGSTDSAIEDAEQKSNLSLREKLGGEMVTYQGSFNIGELPVQMNLEYEVQDISVLPTYLAKKTSVSSLPEAEIVKNLFGDSGKEVKRTLSYTGGDSLNTIMDCQTVYYTIHPDAYDPEKISENGAHCTSWEDADEAFLHTYEGQYNGMNYQLMIAKVDDAQTISFYPKDPGTIIGKPELTQVLQSIDRSVHSADPENPQEIREVSLDVMENSENQSKKDEGELLDLAGSFVREKLQVGLPDDGIEFIRTISRTMDSDNGGTITIQEGDGQKKELLFLDPMTLRDGTLKGAVVNGYAANLSFTLAGLGYASVFETGEFNNGSLWVTDDGVIGGHLDLFYNISEKLSDNVAILSFENAMASFQVNVAENLDKTKVTGSPVTAEYVDLSYAAVASPSKEGEVALVPAWVIPLNSRGYEFATVEINAMDGSLIDIQYRE